MMGDNSAHERRLAGLLFADHHIALLDGDRSVRFVRKDTIQYVKLRFDLLSRHPLIQFLVGFAVAASALYPIRLLWNEEGGALASQAILALGLGLGFIVVRDAFKRRYFLEITHRNAVTKLPFSRDVDISELRERLTKIANDFDYEIDLSGVGVPSFPPVSIRNCAKSKVPHPIDQIQ